jgi:hypothetical protein
MKQKKYTMLQRVERLERTVAKLYILIKTLYDNDDSQENSRPSN